MTGVPGGASALGVPAYFNPAHAPAEWARLALAPAGTIIVVNPDTGPSGAMRADYVAAVAAARRRGCLVYGYVDSAYGARSIAAMSADARLYRAELGVDGVFLDQAGGDPGALAALDGAAAAARRWGLRVAVNPGHPQVAPDVLERFDEVVLFEGPLDAYADMPALTPPREGWAGRPWHLIYGVRSPSVMAAVLSVAAWRGAAVVYVTDGILPNPWRTLPGYWDREVEVVGSTRAHSILPR